MVNSRVSSATKMRKGKSVTDSEVTISTKEEPAPGGDIHVLAVDDCLVDRKVIERLLKTNSFKVTTVDSAARALEVLGVDDEQSTCAGNNGVKVNMIITDYCMPGMTGYDLLKKVKETKGLKEIPVVVMSSENVPQRVSSVQKMQLPCGRGRRFYHKAREGSRYREAKRAYKTSKSCFDDCELQHDCEH